MTDKAYIVAFCDYDVYDIQGIFLDETAANELANALNKGERYKFNGVDPYTVYESFTEWVVEHGKICEYCDRHFVNPSTYYNHVGKCRKEWNIEQLGGTG